MYEYFMENELNVQKANHMFESAFDIFAIKAAEIAQSYLSGTITESSTAEDMIVMEAKNFAQAAKKFFHDLIESFKKMCRDVSLKFSTEIQKRQVNKRLKQIKMELASMHKNGITEQIECFDTKAYMDAYTKYINFLVAEYKKLYNTNYDNFEQYSDAVERCEEAVAKKEEELKIDDFDSFVIMAKFEQAIEMTEKEIDTMNTIIVAQQKFAEEFFKYLDERSWNVDEAQMASDMRKVASQISMKSSRAIKKAVDGPIQKINKILSKIGNKIKGDSGEEDK